MKLVGSILSFAVCFSLFAEIRNPDPIPNIPLYTPSLERKTLYQELEKLNDSDIIVLNFTSSNCPPCEEEVPNLIRYSEEWNRARKKNRLYLWIIFLGDDAETASRFATHLGVKDRSSVYFDRLNTSMRILNIQGTPSTFVVRNRAILFREQGYTEENWKKLVSVLESQR